MSSVGIDEIILATICIAPFAAIGIGALAILLIGDPCEEADE